MAFLPNHHKQSTSFIKKKKKAPEQAPSMEPLPDTAVPENPPVEKSKNKEIKNRNHRKANYIKSKNRTKSIEINQS